VRSRAEGCSHLSSVLVWPLGHLLRGGLPVAVHVHQATWIEVGREVPVEPTLDEHHLDGLTTRRTRARAFTNVPRGSGLWTLLIRIVVHPSKNFDAAPGTSVSEKGSGVFFAQLDAVAFLIVPSQGARSLRQCA
jgi:hypothetical protein